MTSRQPPEPADERDRVSIKASHQVEIMVRGVCHCGGVQWEFSSEITRATACNCTVCRRYAVLWAYGIDGDSVKTTGQTRTYIWSDYLEYHYCPKCACVAFWRAQNTDEQGKYRIAVNLRLAEPDSVSTIPVKRFDGFDTFKGLSDDKRCVGDYGV